MYNNYFNHVDPNAFGIELAELRKEHEQFNFEVLRLNNPLDEWFNKQSSWWVAAVNEVTTAPLIKKIVSKLETVLDKEFINTNQLNENIAVRFYLQKQGAVLVTHQDYPESNVALNFTFDANIAPITFSDIGDVYYKCCLLNVDQFHSVGASPIDRLMMRITPMNFNYQDVCKRFDAAGLFLKT
jgi:hypothetical protein